MSTFDKREQAFEAKFAHDAELQFKVAARRNRLVGLWAAELLGLKGDAAVAYAQSLVKSDLEEDGSEDVFRKLRGDFDGKGIAQSDHQIRRAMDEYLQEAIRQIRDEG